jgi:hypothetical protein
LHALRETNAAGAAKALPENLIYQCFTISSLASFVSNVVLGALNLEASAATNKVQEIMGMLDKYSSFSVKHRDVTPLMLNGIIQGDVVLLTGSTGGFGCNILAQLVASEAVAKIYAVNRPSSQGAHLLSRQADALKKHGFNADALLHSKVVLVESDLTLPTLGMRPLLLEEVSPFFWTFVYF